MGDSEASSSGLVKSTVKYHSDTVEILTFTLESGEGTVAGRQFDWGGRLLKSNGGAQRFPQAGWKSAKERKGRRELDCETDKSSRDESRA